MIDIRTVVHTFVHSSSPSADSQHIVNTTLIPGPLLGRFAPLCVRSSHSRISNIFLARSDVITGILIRINTRVLISS